MRLQDQVILITGSTTGIGEHMARRFIQEGAKVILHGRDAARGEALRKELGEDKAAFFQGSLEDAAYPEKLAADAIAAFGKVDALVNNAALTIRGRIDTTDAAFFDRMMAVNARAPMLLIRALLPELKKNTGVVLNIGSVLAHCGQANMLAYSMSKGALMTMTRNLADSLGMDRVRVNQLNIGWTLSDNEYQVKISDGLGEGWPERLAPNLIPMGRLLMPEDIATAAVYWVGRESYPVTGTVAELEQYPIIGRYANAEGDEKNNSQKQRTTNKEPRTTA